MGSPINDKPRATDPFGPSAESSAKAKPKTDERLQGTKPDDPKTKKNVKKVGEEVLHDPSSPQTTPTGSPKGSPKAKVLKDEKSFATLQAERKDPVIKAGKLTPTLESFLNKAHQSLQLIWQEDTEHGPEAEKQLVTTNLNEAKKIINLIQGFLSSAEKKNTENFTKVNTEYDNLNTRYESLLNASKKLSEPKSSTPSVQPSTTTQPIPKPVQAPPLLKTPAMMSNQTLINTEVSKVKDSLESIEKEEREFKSITNIDAGPAFDRLNSLIKNIDKLTTQISDLLDKSKSINFHSHDTFLKETLEKTKKIKANYEPQKKNYESTLEQRKKDVEFTTTKKGDVKVFLDKAKVEHELAMNSLKTSQTASEHYHNQATLSAAAQKAVGVEIEKGLKYVSNARGLKQLAKDNDVSQLDELQKQLEKLKDGLGSPIGKKDISNPKFARSKKS